MHPKSKIPVAHVFLTLNIGGMEKVGIDLINQLDPDRYENHVVCLQEIGTLGQQLKTSHANVKDVVSLGKPDGMAFSVLFALVSYFRKNRIEVVHTNNSGPHFWAGLAAVLAGVKARVHTNHGRNFAWSARRAWLDRFSSKLSSRIVCVSNDSAVKLSHTDKINPNRLAVITNGIDTLQFSNAEPDQELYGKVGVQPNLCLIGAIARFSTDKDQECLIRAFAKLVQAHPDVCLLLVGDGPTRKQLEVLASDLGVAGRVVFTGFRSDIVEVLRLLSVYVLPSHTEGLSISLLEAMATERPVVASAVGGNPEIIIDGVNGRLVPESDFDQMALVIAQILRDRVYAQSLAKAARKTVVEHYSIGTMAEKYQELYESLI